MIKTLKAQTEEALWDRISDYTNNGYKLYTLPHKPWWSNMYRAKVEAPKGQLEQRLNLEDRG